MDLPNGDVPEDPILIEDVITSGRPAAELEFLWMTQENAATPSNVP